MPRKRVNDNIIGARWQDIRLRGEIIAVNRRTGGLEIDSIHLLGYLSVNRRTGGLEIVNKWRDIAVPVNRRTGGLEMMKWL